MTKQEALNSLYITYNGAYEVPKQDIKRLLDSALREFKTVEKAYDVARFYLGVMFGEQERFTVPEVSRLLDITEAECMELISRVGIKVIQDGF